MFDKFLKATCLKNVFDLKIAFKKSRFPVILKNNYFLIVIESGY